VATVRQPSFAGGELSPNLFGRPDLAKYAVGLARCRNFFITRQGQASTRAGTQFADAIDGKARLVPFVLSDNADNFVLCFENERVTFFRNAVHVFNGGTMLSVSTPITEDELPRLKFVQSGDVLTITRPGNHGPMELRRYGDLDWVLVDVNFSATAQTNNINNSALLFPYGSPTADATHPALPWLWALTVIWRDSRGNTRESNFDVNAPSLADTVIYPDMPLKMNVFNTSSTTPETVLGYRIYRGRNGVYGFIGAVGPIGGDFTDVGIEPDYSSPPPYGTNPFIDLRPYPTTSDYPRVCTYFEERLVFANTPSRPEAIVASATADYYNFDEPFYPVDSMSVSFDLAARRREEIRSLVPLTKLLVFTSSSVWAVGGAGGPLAYNSVDAKVQLEVGANWVDPLVVDGAVLFARTKGTGIRALGFDNNRQSFVGMDISVLAQHLFKGVEVVDMAFAEDPESITWVVLSDGRLLSLTFLRDQDVWAWAWHDTDGAVENVCCIPEGDEDAVYLVVRRKGLFGNPNNYYRCVERMASRGLSSVSVSGVFAQQPWCLDCAVVKANPAGFTEINTLPYLNGKTVSVLADGNVYGPYVVAGGAVNLPQPVTHAIAGLAFTPELETLDPIVPGAETRLVEKIVNRVVVEVADSNSFSVGPDFDNLREWRSRRVSDGYGAVGARSEAAQVNVRGGWGPTGRVCIRQPNPLPLTVLGITREVEPGNP
jgi:hypothetical protein